MGWVHGGLGRGLANKEGDGGNESLAAHPMHFVKLSLALLTGLSELSALHEAS